MSLSNSGFDGTVTELPFAFMWGVGVGGDSVESSAAWAVTQGTGRQVSVAAQSGYAFGHGVLSKETSAAILQALSTPVAGGWFLICRHIDWTTNTVSVVALVGPTTTTTIPTAAPADYSSVSGMATSPGVTYDHPLAWAWVRNTDTTMALFDLRKLALATRITVLETPVAEPADLTALAALSPADGTFKSVLEGGARFLRVSGVWVQQTTATFATATARDTAYAKASAAYRVANAMSRVLTERFNRRYNGTRWTPDGAGLFPIIPIVPTPPGGSATVGVDGTVTATAATGISLEGIPTEFQHLVADIDFPTIAGVVNLLLRLGLSSTHADLVTAGAYAYTGISDVTRSAGTATGFYLSRNASGVTSAKGLIDIYDLGIGVGKAIKYDIAAALSGVNISEHGVGSATDTTVRDRITFATDSTTAITGTVKLFGYAPE